MSITLNDNFDLRAPKILDRKGGPFASVNAALQAISVTSRVNGLSVVISNAEGQSRHWFRDGALVPEIAESTFNTTFKLIDVAETEPGEGEIALEPGYHMMKATLDQNSVYIDGSTALPGTSGYLIIIQDDVSSRIPYLKGNGVNQGSIFAYNYLPRSRTILQWFRDDEYCYWSVVRTVSGIFPTIKPVFRVDDVANTIELFHALPMNQLEWSENNGPWITYTGRKLVGAVDRPAGYWKARVKDDPSRTESPIAYSLPFTANRKGLPYVLPFELS